MEALRQEIERALDERVRPRLRLHGGGVELVCLRGGVLRVRLTGACSGCPSAALTTIWRVVRAAAGQPSPPARWWRKSSARRWTACARWNWSRGSAPI